MAIWVENKLYPILTVRYEDLQNDALNTFKQVINFISKISKSEEKFNKENINLISKSSNEIKSSIIK